MVGTYLQRQRSRRIVAAKTFLANISLDGTYADTDLYEVYKQGNMRKLYQPESHHAPSDSKFDCKLTQMSTDETKETENKLKIDESIDNKENRLPVVIRDKHITPEINKRSFRKRNTNSISGIEKNSCLSSSSNESLAITGIGGKIRKTSSTISDSSNTIHEVKTIKFTSGIRVRNERVTLVSSGNFPCHITSFIPFNCFVKQETLTRETRKRHTSGPRPLSTISDSTDPAHLLGMVGYEESSEVSYSDLLIPSRNLFSKPRTFPDIEESKPEHVVLARCFSYEPSTHKTTAHYLPSNAHAVIDKEEPTVNKQTVYEPNVVDDPELQAGKHRKLLRFPTFMASVLYYTKDSELKKELNDKFKKKFPHINITLSKLRSLKREMLKIATECGIDLLSVAYSYVYFEQLVMKSVVTKQTRKLIAGACLILSAKLNDVKGEALGSLIEKTETIFRLTRRELVQWEFATLVSLEFSLHIPVWQAKPHYQRLLSES